MIVAGFGPGISTRSASRPAFRHLAVKRLCFLRGFGLANEVYNILRNFFYSPYLPFPARVFWRKPGITRTLFERLPDGIVNGKPLGGGEAPGEGFGFLRQIEPGCRLAHRSGFRDGDLDTPPGRFQPS